MLFLKSIKSTVVLAFFAYCICIFASVSGSQTKLLPSCCRSRTYRGTQGWDIPHQITLLRVFCHSAWSQLLLVFIFLVAFCFSPLSSLLAPKVIRPWSCPFRSHVLFISHQANIGSPLCECECCEEALMESRHKFKFYYCSYYGWACRETRGKNPDTGYRGQANLYGNTMWGIYTNKHRPIWSRAKERVRETERKGR